jgi:DNA mismatch endonuclease, patch repair protein
MPKTEKQIHDNMSRIRGKDTSIELILRHALYQDGIRYRKNVKTLPGCPDIVLSKYKIAIFCDGDFFHGYDFSKIQNNLKSNKEFWINKIDTNRKRDLKTDEALVGMGYLVLRFWEHEIHNQLNQVLEEINLAIIHQERREENQQSSKRSAN